jgi:RHS repeat-associated protein
MTTLRRDRQDGQHDPMALPGSSFRSSDRLLEPAVLADDSSEAEDGGAGPCFPGMYLHARYYDPQLGIFLSPDPIGVAGGMNAYGYAFGNPVNLTDRSGLNPGGAFCYPYGSTGARGQISVW